MQMGFTTGKKEHNISILWYIDFKSFLLGVIADILYLTSDN